MSYKAIEMSAEMADKLKKRLPAMVHTSTFDVNGDPVITIAQDSTPAAGEKVIIIRTKALTFSLAKDVLGLPETVFTPHVLQICTEANFAGTTDNVADILGPIELLPIIATAGKTGCKVEWHVTANGTIPSTAAIDAGTVLKASYESELYWGMLASQ